MGIDGLNGNCWRRLADWDSGNRQAASGHYLSMKVREFKDWNPPVWLIRLTQHSTILGLILPSCGL